MTVHVLWYAKRCGKVCVGVGCRVCGEDMGGWVWGVCTRAIQYSVIHKCSHPLRYDPQVQPPTKVCECQSTVVVTATGKWLLAAAQPVCVHVEAPGCRRTKDRTAACRRQLRKVHYDLRGQRLRLNESQLPRQAAEVLYRLS